MIRYLSACFLMLGVHLATAACEKVTVYSGGANEYMYVPEPGNYCAQKDLHHTDAFDLHSFSRRIFTGKPLFSVLGPTRARELPDERYVIDFQRHTLSAETRDMVGISSAGEIRKVLLTKGGITVPGDQTPNIGIFLAINVDGVVIPGLVAAGNLWNPLYEDIPYTKFEKGRKPRYSMADYAIDDMDVRAGYRGVVLGGGNNVIRNSRIEVDGNTAIYVYGPGTIIENNTIIVHGKGESKQWDAAIKLRDAG